MELESESTLGIICTSLTGLKAKVSSDNRKWQYENQSCTSLPLNILRAQALLQLCSKIARSTRCFKTGQMLSTMRILLARTK